METRLLVTAALAGLTVLGAAGCSSKEPALGGTTATVTIDGNDAGSALPVTCRQNGYSWLIETPQQKQGFSAALETGGPATAKSVQFRGIGGFSGEFWADNIGDAQVTGSGGRYTISGTANGTFDQAPSKDVTAKFRIQTNC
jgi:ipoprotein LpqH